MPNFNSLKSFWDSLSANWTPFAPGNQPYLIPYHEDIPVYQDSTQVTDPSPDQTAHDHSPSSHAHRPRDFSNRNRPAIHARRGTFNTHEQCQHEGSKPAHIQFDKRAAAATSSPTNEHHLPHANLSRKPTPSVSTTTTTSTAQAKMTRKRSTSASSSRSSSSSSSSNSSTHHAREALKAIQCVYGTRPSTHLPSASPTMHVQGSSKPTQQHSSPSGSTTTPNEHISYPHLAPPPTEHTPLLSPIVSPLAPTTFPPHTHEPFPDLEPGPSPASPSDSSYEGLDVFGTHRARRRWDLGVSHRSGGELWEDRRGEAWDGCLLVYFFVAFVLVVVGGGVVLVWVLLCLS